MLELVSYLTVLSFALSLRSRALSSVSRPCLTCISSRCLARICLSPPVALVGSRCMDSSRMDTLISSAEKGC